MEEIIRKIKQKKELSDMPESIIKQSLENYLSKKRISLPNKPKELKLIIKAVRSDLRKYTGMFQIKSSSKKRSILLKSNKIKELLKTHASTKERLDNYEILRKIISRINPASILDLGCGLNPMAIASANIKYYAYDIKEEELKLIDSFFKMKNISGKTFFKDITQESKFPKADLCLILKTLDVLEKQKKNASKELIKKINCKTIVSSFSTKTLSGKPMNSPRRIWFESILKELNLSFEATKTNNEIFYVIDKCVD